MEFRSQNELLLLLFYSFVSITLVGVCLCVWDPSPESDESRVCLYFPNEFNYVCTLLAIFKLE